MSDIGITFQLEFWHWMILAAALAGIEILTPGFFFLWLGGAALVTGDRHLLDLPGMPAIMRPSAFLRLVS